MVNQQTVSGKKQTGVLAAVVIDTVVFGNLIKGVLGSNPFETMAILSNMQVSAYVSNADFSLPDPVTLPAPFDSTRNIKRGFCFDGRIGNPTISCGEDPICSLAKSELDEGTSLTVQGCMDKDDVSLMIGVADIKLSKSATLRTAGLTYTAVSSPLSVAFGAEATLDVVMEDPVTFNGKLYLKQSGALSLLGFSLAASGMIPRAFGVERLQMYDLVLAAEVGVAAGAPVVKSMTIGGGICFGKYSNCDAMVSGSNEEELIAQGHRTVPRFDDYHEHLTMLQSQAKTTGTIAAKLYAGFDATGKAFFYAGITAVTMADIAKAFVGSNKLPDWMSKVGIEAFDQDTCDTAGGRLPVAM